MKSFYLEGRWESAKATHAVLNPWNGETIAEVCLAEAAQVERAVASSHTAFASTRKTPAAERSRRARPILCPSSWPRRENP